MSKLAARIVVTIDGLSGSGKTSLARELAKRLGFIVFNSGLIFRSMAALVLDNKINPRQEQAVIELVRRLKLRLEASKNGETLVYINEVNKPIAELKRPELSEATSIISQYPLIRDVAKEIARTAFSETNIVAEGRDMGSVVFPEAPIKFFVSADVQARIDRRIAELYPAGSSANENDVNSLKRQMEIEISERDLRDTQRKESPAKPAADAVLIDNSHQPLTKVVERMYSHCSKILGASRVL